jgi:hypothetical protein
VLLEVGRTSRLHLSGRVDYATPNRVVGHGCCLWKSRWNQICEPSALTFLRRREDSGWLKPRGSLEQRGHWWSMPKGALHLQPPTEVHRLQNPKPQTSRCIVPTTASSHNKLTIGTYRLWMHLTWIEAPSSSTPPGYIAQQDSSASITTPSILAPCFTSRHEDQPAQSTA